MCIYIYIYTRIFARASRALDSPVAYDIGHYHATIWPTCSNTLGSISHTCTRDDTCKLIQCGEERTARPCTITDVISDKAHAHIHRHGREKKTCVNTWVTANTNTSLNVRIIHRQTYAHAHTHERTHALQHILLHSYIDAHERVHKHTHTHTHTRARKRTNACILAHTERIHAHIFTTHKQTNKQTNKQTHKQIHQQTNKQTNKQVHIRTSSRTQTHTSTHIHEKTRCNTCAWQADTKRYPWHLPSWKTTRRKKCADNMRRQYQRQQHDKTGRLSRSRMCKSMHETCWVAKFSYNGHSNANMTQLSNGQITKHLRPSKHEPNESPLMHVHARKGNCPAWNANRVFINPRKCQVPLKQSVDLLGKQNKSK